jgi:hydroxymethylbilane synthase
VVAPLNDAATAWQMAAERAFLIVLEGSCRTPLAGHAVLNGDRIAFRGMALLLDGSDVFEARREGAVGDAEALGRDAGEEVRALAGPRLVV